MKKFMTIFIAVNALLGVAVFGTLAGLLYLAEAAPFDHTSAFYGLQMTAENWRLRLDGNAIRRAEFALKLADRRLADLARAQGASEIAKAAGALNETLDAVIRGIDSVPASSRDALFARLDVVLSQTALILDGIEQDGESAAFAALHEKVAALLAAQTREEMIAAVPPAPSLAAEVIPFLSRDVAHESYPLEGGHAGAECASCHADGAYKGTTEACVDCHRTAVNGVYPQHFEGECTDCHTVDSWEPAQFDHLAVVECQSCHAEDTPPEHYILADPRVKFLAALVAQPARGVSMPPPEDLVYEPCVRCHTNTTSWEDAVFDHFSFNDCAACHTGEDTPEDHYPGQCSNCHVVEDWQAVWFNHEGFPDCAACHEPDTATHYPGACADCHTTGDWFTITYTHLAQSVCIECHAGDKPDAHYEGRCENCHTTGDWSAVTFDHTGYTDCASCHTRDGHYSTQCSGCHTTSTWGDVRFDHAGLSGCEQCHSGAKPSPHYSGACSNCHSTGGWGNVNFSHGDYNNCVDCHSDDLPARHYDGQCVSCHTTNSWQQIAYDHSGARLCQDCHAGEVPVAGHYTDECAACHVKESWSQVSFGHTSVTTCTACHDDDVPDGHYPDACASCHTTESWDFTHRILSSCSSCHTKEGHWPGECSLCHESVVDWNVYTFDHTSAAYTNCKSCHPRPSGHPRGQCSRCHTTESWLDTLAALPDLPASTGTPPERPAAPPPPRP